MENKKLRDIVIIGSGPAGLTAAIYSSRAELSTLVVGGLKFGGQLMLTTEVENFPGFESILGPELMQKMIDQAKKSGAEILFEDVTKVDLSKRPFKVYAGDEEYQSKALIVATGANAKMLNVPGEDKLLGRGVSVCATCDGAFFRNQEIAIVGGGDTAMEEAIFLTKFATKVYLLVRSTSSRASKVMLRRAEENSKIEFIYSTEVKEIFGDEKVTGIKIYNSKKNEDSTLNITGLFIAIGYMPSSDLFKGLINVDDLGYLQPVHRTHSNIEGVFIAGDIEDKIYRQAITAAGDGCKAAMDAQKWLEENS